MNRRPAISGTASYGSAVIDADGSRSGSGGGLLRCPAARCLIGAAILDSVSVPVAQRLHVVSRSGWFSCVSG